MANTIHHMRSWHSLYWSRQAITMNLYRVSSSKAPQKTSVDVFPTWFDDVKLCFNQPKFSGFGCVRISGRAGQQCCYNIHHIRKNQMFYIGFIKQLQWISAENWIRVKAPPHESTCVTDAVDGRSMTTWSCMRSWTQSEEIRAQEQWDLVHLWKRKRKRKRRHGRVRS